jgi:hypothetical protein
VDLKQVVYIQCVAERGLMAPQLRVRPPRQCWRIEFWRRYCGLETAEKGFSLIELMVSSASFFVVAGTVLNLLVITQKRYQTAMRLGMFAMSKSR